MSIDPKFLEELEQRVTAAASRLNIPSEFTRAFKTLFTTFIQIFYLEGALRRGVQHMSDDAQRQLLESLRGSLDVMLQPLLEGMRNLGSQWIDIQDFLKEVEDLKSFCDDQFASL